MTNCLDHWLLDISFLRALNSIKHDKKTALADQVWFSVINVSNEVRRINPISELWKKAKGGDKNIFSFENLSKQVDGDYRVFYYCN